MGGMRAATPRLQHTPPLLLLPLPRSHHHQACQHQETLCFKHVLVMVMRAWWGAFWWGAFKACDRCGVARWLGAMCYWQMCRS